MKTKLILVFFCFCFFISTVHSQDWSQWRGPNRDGALVASAIPGNWPEELTRVWRVEVGEGHSSPIVRNGKIFIFSRQNDQETVSCIDPGNGKSIWQQSYPAPYKMHPAATGHGKGPKSTPVASNNALVTMGISGILSCYDTENGKLNWQKKFAGEFENSSPVYGAAMSPLVSDNLLIIHVGGHDDGALIAADLRSGKIKWQWTGDGPSYASPIIATFQGTKQVVNFSQEHIIGIDFKTGKLLWQVPFKTPWLVSCATPLLVDNDLILTGYNQGVMRLRVLKKGGTWSTEQVWKKPQFGNYMNTPVLFGNSVVTFSDRNKGQYGILDAATGEIYWRSRGRQGDNAALIQAGEFLLSLQTDSRLIVSKPAKTGLQILREYSVADSPTWAHPAIFDKKMLIKDKTNLTLWSLE
ncbi:MAG: PQQ-binding-like beta-propeller repeat protein [bacterium]